MQHEARVEALKNRHENLDVMIQQELNRPRPDELEILNLKKAKLRIKDEISRLAPH